MASRVLENLGVVYMGLYLCGGLKPGFETHLVNFLGYSTSNIIFLIKLLSLGHELPEGRMMGIGTRDILAVISEFERESYLA
jgi:hypothetical protein